MQAYTDGKFRQPAIGKARLHPQAEILALLDHVYCRGERAPRMVRIRLGRAEYRHHRIPDVLVDHAAAIQDRLAYLGKIRIEHFHHLVGVELLGDGGEIADIGKQHRHMAFLAGEVGPVVLGEQRVDDVVRHIAPEHVLQARSFALLARQAQRDGAQIGDRQAHLHRAHRNDPVLEKQQKRRYQADVGEDHDPTHAFGHAEIQEQ